MPRYVLHIGPSKTGSTYLQRRLFHARAALLADGICYPDNWWTKAAQIDHNPLTELLRRNRFAEVAAEFRRIAAQDHRIVVISSEDIEGLAPAQFAALRAAMGSDPVEVVFYCRRWSERMPSIWKQVVKTGLCPTLPEWYTAAVRHAHFSALANYSLIWNIVCEVFGRSSLRLVSYDRLRDARIDLFRHFSASFLDWQEPAGLAGDGLLENVSLNATDTEILRALNWLDAAARGPHSRFMHVRFIEMRPQFDTRSIEQMMAGSTAGFEISDASEDFRLSWRDMQQFGDCLVPRSPPRTPLFEFRSATAPYEKPGYLVNEGAAAELHRLYRQLRQAATPPT